MSRALRFNRLEAAGSLGDLGTLLPLAIGMILINGLSPSGLFLSVGLYFIFSGLYFGVTTPVQPMKVIGAYAIATSISATEIAAAGLWIAVILLIMGGTGVMQWVGKWVPKPVVRGVQLSTGILLMMQGFRFMRGTSEFQQLQGLAEPYLKIQHVGPFPVGLIIGVTGMILTLLLLSNKRFPAGLMVILGGLAAGLVWGTHEAFQTLRIGLYLPGILPFGVPSLKAFTFALLVLVLPQIPMTVGNAVIANADLSHAYFGRDARRVTYGALCISMSLANFLSFLIGGMPLCHGAGGLAAHYRFGARTAGSNLMIGFLFVLLPLFLGDSALAIFYLLPMSVLGVLLVFAGSQLSLTLVDIDERQDLFVTLLMLGITLVSNLAISFAVGIFVAHLLKWKQLTV